MESNYILRLDDNNFEFIHNRRTVMDGSREAVKKSMESYGFDDVDLAIDDMIKNNNNIAYFGIYKKFLYSKET